MKKCKIKFKFMFAWYDLWIGVCIVRGGRTVYIFPLPTIGLKIFLVDWAKELNSCPSCKSGYEPGHKMYGVKWRINSKGSHNATCENCSHGCSDWFDTKEEAFGHFNKKQDWMTREEN